MRLIATLMIMMWCGVLSFSSHASEVCPAVHSDESSTVTKFKYDTLASSTIYFRHDKAAIDSNYLDNRSSLNSIRKALQEIASESPQSIASIIIEGYSSPIGNEPYNLRLSLKRAQKAEAFLRTIPGLENVDMVVTGKGEDWQTFERDVKNGYKRKNRKDVIYILNLKTSSYRKERKFKALEKDHTTWRYLVRNYMSTSRHAVTIVVVKKNRIIDILPQVEEPMAKAEALCKDALAIIRPCQSEPVHSVKKSNQTKERVLTDIPAFAVRTNLLVPALNVGAELPLGNSWSVAADYYYPWIWPNKKNRHCFELLGWSVEGRYWFGRDRQAQDRLKGHSIGLYMAGGYYDFERNFRGIQGEFVSPGLDYTYSMAVGRKKRVHMQFTLAVGYIRSWGRTYNVFGDYGELYPDDGLMLWNYFGPTKAAVTLVVPFYKKEGGR